MNKVALVTGASRGIGKAIALKLAREGYDICVNYLNSRQMAEHVCNEINRLGRKALCIGADIGKLAEVHRMFATIFQEFNTIDLLVNNAGITEYQPFLECSEELWDKINNTDWKGSFFVTQCAAKRMVETHTKGVIINITSIHSESNFPIANVYGPTKAALEKFTQHAALELAQFGIRVVAVAPGCTKIIEGEDETPRGKQLKKRIPLGRYADCEDVAQAVAWIASENASYITGTSLRVDGGCLLPVNLDNIYVEGVRNKSGRST